MTNPEVTLSPDDGMFEVPGKVLGEYRELKSMLRRVFDGKGIEYDSNGWAEVTMHSDEVAMIQEAIRVH